MSSESKIYTSKVLDVLENGDAILELPPEMCDELGWKEGDVLSIDLVDGLITMKKLEKGDE